MTNDPQPEDTNPTDEFIRLTKKGDLIIGSFASVFGVKLLEEMERKSRLSAELERRLLEGRTHGKMLTDGEIAVFKILLRDSEGQIKSLQAGMASGQKMDSRRTSVGKQKQEAA